MTQLITIYMVINWLCINITAKEIDTRSIAEIVKAKRLVIEVVIIYEADSQVIEVARVDNSLD